jgi:hypothetical protein
MLVYRYRIARSVPFVESEASFCAAILAVEILHGATQVRLDARHATDLRERTWLVHADTEVGRNLNRLFAGLLASRLGESSFRVERLEVTTPPRSPRAQEVAA